MYQSKVLLVLDMHLICATFLKVDFGTVNQLLVKDPFKHLTWNVQNFGSSCIIFVKIIRPRRLTGSWICFRPLFFNNALNLLAPVKQNPILYLQILQSFTKTLRQLSGGVLWEWRIWVTLEVSLDEVQWK